MSNRLVYLYFNELDTDDEGTFTIDLSNANSKDVVDFIKLLKSKHIKKTTTLLKNKLICVETLLSLVQKFHLFLICYGACV